SRVARHDRGQRPAGDAELDVSGGRDGGARQEAGGIGSGGNVLVQLEQVLRVLSASLIYTSTALPITFLPRTSASASPALASGSRCEMCGLIRPAASHPMSTSAFRRSRAGSSLLSAPMVNPIASASLIRRWLVFAADGRPLVNPTMRIRPNGAMQRTDSSNTS